MNEFDVRLDLAAAGLSESAAQLVAFFVEAMQRAVARYEALDEEQQGRFEIAVVSHVPADDPADELWAHTHTIGDSGALAALYEGARLWVLGMEFDPTVRRADPLDLSRYLDEHTQESS